MVTIAIASHEQRKREEPLIDLDARVQSKKKFRLEGAGRTFQVPAVRQSLLDWVIDVLDVLKGRLPTSIFVAKAKHIYNEYLKSTNTNIAPEDQLKFSKNGFKAG